ncbi:MAG: NADH-quinone oxidoreductase subunit C [archaeon GBS-70-058]|nr:NADH-quinone oxidoreductase subunit C [Candidatus Culexarchaeum nevadense]
MSTFNMEFIVKDLMNAFPNKILDYKFDGARSVFVSVDTGILHDVIRYLKDRYYLKHITTITGTDLGDSIELIYHLSPLDRRVLVNVKVRISRDNPHIPSIVPLLPGAVLYEREVHDLLGVIFDGHPSLERLILPDDWPEGVYPLRKDYKVEVG